MKNNIYIKLGRDFSDLIKWFGLEAFIFSPTLVLPFLSLNWKSIFLVLLLYLSLFLSVLWHHYNGRLIFNRYGIWTINKHKGNFQRKEIPWDDICEISYRVEATVPVGLVTWSTINQYVDIVYKKRDRNGFVLQKSKIKSTLYLDDYLSYFDQDCFLTRIFYWLKSVILRIPYTKEDRPVLTYDKHIDYCLRHYCEMHNISYSLTHPL